MPSEQGCFCCVSVGWGTWSYLGQFPSKIDHSWLRGQRDVFCGDSDVVNVGILSGLEVDRCRQTFGAVRRVAVQLVGVRGHILVNFCQKLIVLGSADRGVCFGDSDVVGFGIHSGRGIDCFCLIPGVGIDWGASGAVHGHYYVTIKAQ